MSKPESESELAALLYRYISTKLHKLVKYSRKDLNNSEFLDNREQIRNLQIPAFHTSTRLGEQM